jgi:hypothetical protein
MNIDIMILKKVEEKEKFLIKTHVSKTDPDSTFILVSLILRKVS